ncbi:MAG: tyrosine-type recombinase/integrase [Arachnia sp.]
MTTSNVRRRLRAILDEAGISGVTPHAFRRTVATVLDRASGADRAADMLGHTSSKITQQHYIEPDETVNPVTAEILEALAPKGRQAALRSLLALARELSLSVRVDRAAGESPGGATRHERSART